MTILVVDDDPLIVALLKEYFSAGGHWVEGAGDGYSAMVALAKHKPALVILDYEMPAGSGGDVYDRIRAQGGATLPIIFLTGKPLLAELRVSPGPAVRILSKPVDFPKLDAAIQELLPATGKRAGPP